MSRDKAPLKQTLASMLADLDTISHMSRVKVPLRLISASMLVYLTTDMLVSQDNVRNLKKCGLESF